MKINKPSKVLQTFIDSESGTEFWPFKNKDGDKWWKNGSNPKFYRFKLEVTITIQSHGSHLTRKPFEYNGLDIYVGDWIARVSNGKALKIISVESKTETSATIIAEDVLRYNTFRSDLGESNLQSGTSLIFETNEQGKPIFDPLPFSGLGTTFLGNINSRFEAFNEQQLYMLTQNNHDFKESDLISIDENENFVKASDKNFQKIIGTINDTGPGPNNFLITPFNKIFEKITPALPGRKGDIIYASKEDIKNLTLENTGKPIYLQISNAIPTKIIGSVINATTTIGNEININDEVIFFSNEDIDGAINDINTKSSETFVIASKFLRPTETISKSDELFYGLVGANLSSQNPQIEINGNLVTFTTTNDGEQRFGPGFATDVDFVEDINNANIPGIFAETTSDNKVIIKETNANSISITNITNDSSNAPWAGLNSITGIPLETSVSNNNSLQLTKNDGNGIILKNENGTPLEDFGIKSAQNGSLPIGLTLEQGLRKGTNYVVSDISARNAVTPLIGDTAFVINSGQNEWAFFLWNGSQWVQITDEDASNVDAKTISKDVNFNDQSPIIIGRLSDKSRISWVSVEVITEWNDNNSTLEIGDNEKSDRFIGQNLNDLSQKDVYSFNPSFQYDNGGLETEILISFDSKTSTQGSAKVTITYT